MFFAISKIVWFVIQPSTLMVLGLLGGLMKLYRLDFERGRRWLAGSTLALLIAGLTPVSDLLIRPLDNRFPRADLTKGEVTGIIVLGGAEDTRISDERELMALNEAGERVTEAVALARLLPKARLFFSGGSEALLRTKQPEAQKAKRLFAALGVEASRMTLEDRSRNTAENASFTKAMLDPKAGERWIVITSAWHMPRAIGCFRAVGFEVEAWPVDYRTTDDFDPLKFHSSIPEGLRRLDFAIKEYLGLVIYRLTGRSDALFPGPR